MRQSVRTFTKLAHFWSDILWFPPYGPATLSGMISTSPQGEHSLVESRYDHWWRLPDVYVGAKNSTGFPNRCWKIRHDEGKCTRFWCCFDHYRMLAYKISACEVCVIWRKPTEALKNPSPIAESRTGKPAMVTLKIQPDCFTVHYTTLSENIFVRSLLGCKTDSVSIRSLWV